MSTLPALLVALLCGWLSYLVSRNYLRNHRLSNLFWGVSLFMSAIASLSYAFSLWTSPHNPFLFTIYYLFGAMWMPSIMGLGSLALVFPERVVRWMAGFVVVLGLVGTVFLFVAPVSTQTLSHLDGGAGVGVIAAGGWLPFLIILNSFGGLAVLFVALVSAWKTFRKQSPSRFLYGNLWLAIGIVVISSAGTSARLGWPGMFWAVMLVGWLITFVGYRFLTPTAGVHVLMTKRQQVGDGSA